MSDLVDKLLAQNLKVVEDNGRLKEQLGRLKEQLKERDDVILILKIRSRIEELESKFLSRRAALLSRKEKWRIILTDISPFYIDNIELMQFRNAVSRIPPDLFINTVGSLYSEMSNAAAYQIRFQVQYDDNSICNALRDAGMTPDDSKIRVVSCILSPIKLP